MSELADVDVRGGSLWRSWCRSWTSGLGLCLFFAVVVAACSLSSADDQSTATPPTGEVTTTADTIAAADTTEPAGTVPAGTDPAGTEPTASEPAGTEPAPTAPLDPDAIGYTAHIEPIVSGVCASCHTGDGPGTQHVRFDTAGDVARLSWAVAEVVESRFMPPWPASAESVAFRGDWSLTDEEIAAIIEWDAEGSPLDVATDEPLVATNGVVGIDDPDIRALASGSYDGEFGQPDEYRCFIYDPETDERSYASQIEFIPEQEQVVHHAIGFLVRAADRAELEAIDGADGNGGWTCFGFSPSRSAELVFGWAPGQTPTEYPEGTGLQVGAGDFFVIQTHYHFDVEAPGDQSTLAIEWAEGDDVVPVDFSTYLAPAEIPCRSDESGPLCDRAAARARAIDAYGPEGVLADVLLAVCGTTPADYAHMTDGVASASCDWPVRSPGTIVSVLGHEHELGATFRMTLNPDTPGEVVLLDIPVWDFDWQLNYEPLHDIELTRGDTIRIECSWDRSLRDPSLEPAYVLWADGTDDEMCFSTIVTRPR